MAQISAASNSDARCEQRSDFEGRAATLSLQKLSSKAVSTKLCAACEIGLIHGCLCLQGKDEEGSYKKLGGPLQEMEGLRMALMDVSNRSFKSDTESIVESPEKPRFSKRCDDQMSSTPFSAFDAPNSHASFCAISFSTSTTESSSWPIGLCTLSWPNVGRPMEIGRCG